VLELIAAAACAVAIDAQQDGALRLRPACPAPFSATRAAVGEALARSAGRRELTLDFGRLAGYPWLSALLARQASSSRQWREDAEAGAYVTRALLGMPEFTVLFDPPWRIEGLAVREVRLKPARELDLAQGHPLPPERLLPYDAQLRVRLSR
jgi:hypothetical protein